MNDIHQDDLWLYELIHSNKIPSLKIKVCFNTLITTLSLQYKCYCQNMHRDK